MPRVLVVLSLLVLGAAAPAAQPQPSQYDVKAVFLYNFLRYVEWLTRPPTGPYVLCVVGLDRVESIIAETVKGERIDGRPIVSRLIHEPEDDCHVIFAPTGINTARYARAARGTLTVSDSEGFLQRGGVINFIEIGGKVRFEIDTDAADRAGVRISSRLLRLRWTGAAGSSR